MYEPLFTEGDGENSLVTSGV